MGSLVPALSLVPVLGFFAWLLADVFVFGGVPVFSAVCFVGIIAVVGIYLAQYMRFAKHDPDRLQSEQYRIQMQQLQMIKAKDLRDYLPADVLAQPTSMLADTDKNVDDQENDTSTASRDNEDNSK